MPTTDKLNPDSKSQAAELRHDPSSEPTTAKVKSTTSRKSKFRIFLFAALLLAIAAVTATCFFRLDYPYLSTEDAYVHGNQIFLTPRVTGTVVAINADDTDLVQKGQPLVVLDDSDAKVQLLQAEGALGDTMRKVCQLFVSVRQSKANVEARGIDLAKAEDDYRRRTSAQSGTVSAEDITHARQSADTVLRTRYYSGELVWVSLSTSKTMGFFPTPGSSGKSNGLKALAPERGAAVSLRDQQQPVFSRPFSLDLNGSPDKRFPNFRWLSGSKISPNSVAGSKRRKRKLGPHKRHDSNP